MRRARPPAPRAGEPPTPTLRPPAPPPPSIAPANYGTRRVLRSTVACLAAALCAWVAGASPARAQLPPPVPVPLVEPPPPLVWSPAWSTVGTADYAITIASAGLALAGAIVAPVSPRATGGVLFDEGARSALRLPTSSGRYLARDTSDVLLSLNMTFPFFADALVSAYWYRQSPDVAYQIAIINAEALMITAAIHGVTNTLVSRERPYGRECGGELPVELTDCEGSARYRSFFSGHAALSFTSAALVCSHHLRLGLLGGPWDTATCVTGFVMATTTATLRVVADMHYTSDVLTGAVVGTLVGFLVPALHYGFGDDSGDGARAVQLQLVPTGAGLGVVGTF